jgi:hypothetical protein
MRLSREQKQDRVVALVEAGIAPREAAAGVGVPDRTFYTWRGDPRTDFGDRIDRALQRSRGETPPVPDFVTFRRDCLGHDTPAHQMVWVEALRSTGLPLFPGDDTTSWDGIIRYCRMLIIQPPEMGKSSFAEDLIVWLTCLTRRLKSLFVSKASDVAKDRLYRIKSLLEDDGYYQREGLRNVVLEWGPFKPHRADPRRWGVQQIYVLGSSAADRDATVEAVGIGNQIQGNRTDVAVLDDVFTLENQMSELEREKQRRWMGQTLLSRLPADGGLCLVLGTRATELDNNKSFLEWDVFDALVQPAILDDETTLWPERWPMEKLLKRRQEVIQTAGEQAWLLTYQQQATDLPDAPFRLAALEAAKDASVDYEPGYKPPGSIVVAGIDPAYVGTCAIVVLAVDPTTKKRMVLDVVAKRGLRTLDNLKGLLVKTATTWRPVEIKVENDAFQGGTFRDYDLAERLREVVAD